MDVEEVTTRYVRSVERGSEGESEEDDEDGDMRIRRSRFLGVSTYIDVSTYNTVFSTEGEVSTYRRIDVSTSAFS